MTRSGFVQAAIIEALIDGVDLVSPDLLTIRPCYPEVPRALVATDTFGDAMLNKSGEFISVAQRSAAIAEYTERWTCSGAALARAAKVNPADLSKWKKGLLPAKPDKKARIEKALPNNEAPF